MDQNEQMAVGSPQDCALPYEPKLVQKAGLDLFKSFHQAIS